MPWLRYATLLCVCALSIIRAQDDVVGCGGFVRSKYLTNFSRIKVTGRGALFRMCIVHSTVTVESCECSRNDIQFLCGVFFSRSTCTQRVEQPSTVVSVHPIMATSLSPSMTRWVSMYMHDIKCVWWVVGACM